MNVSFLGLGIMGSRMAAHLAEAANLQLTTWNRSAAPRERIAARGAATTASARDAVTSADLVITMLANPEVVRQVVLAGGLLDAMPKGSIWADSSTVDPAFALECDRAARAAGVHYLGTPVAGTRGPAEAGTLKVLVGGASELLDRARPALEAFSAGIIHVGEAADRGAAFKILVNGMLAQSMLVFAETLKVGVAQGLDREFLLKALPGLPVIAPFVQSKAEAIRHGDFSDVHFPLEHMHKDLHLLVKTAFEVDQPAPLAAISREVYGEAKRRGRGREDFAAVAD